MGKRLGGSFSDNVYIVFEEHGTYDLWVDDQLLFLKLLPKHVEERVDYEGDSIYFEGHYGDFFGEYKAEVILDEFKEWVKREGFFDDRIESWGVLALTIGMREKCVLCGLISQKNQDALNLLIESLCPL